MLYTSSADRPRSQRRGVRPRPLAVEELESRLCPASGSALTTLGSGPGYTLKLNNFGRVAVLEISPEEYARWAVGHQSAADTQLMARRLYDHLRDRFDFLFFVNNEEFIRPDVAYSGLNTPVKNDTAGIGGGLFDATAQFGSAGRLQSVLHLTERAGLQYGPGLHELMHRWGNYLTDIDGGEPSHWGFSSVGGQLGGFQFGTLRDLGGGRFDADGPRGGSWFSTIANGGNSIPYSQLELYLMGLIGPDQVTAPIQVAENATFVDSAQGTFQASGIKTVTIQDLVNREGARVPSAANAQKRFTALATVLTPAPLTQAALDQVDTDVELFSRAGDDGQPSLFNFWEATGGRATLDMQAVDAPPQIQFGAATFEAREDGGSATITVTRSGDSGGGATVAYATSDGTAHARGDYTATSGTLTFAAGETGKTLTIPLVNNTGVEDDRTVNLTLSNPTGGARLGPRAAALLTIVDDDLAGLQAPDQPFTDTVFTAGSSFARSYEHYFDFVGKAYRRYLNREPDAAGREFWIGTLLSGLYSEQRVEGYFVGSPEYVNFRYGGSPSAFVVGLYRDLLRRPQDPSASEIQGWLSLLQGGATTDAVAFAFANSPERFRLTVIDNYAVLLGRAPDEAEITAWVNSFRAGATNEQMIGGFVGSPEYYGRATKGRGNRAAWVSHAYQDVLFRVPRAAEVQGWLRFLG